MSQEAKVYEGSDIQVTVTFSQDQQRVSGTFTYRAHKSRRRIIGVIRLGRRQGVEAGSYSGEALAYYAFPENRADAAAMWIGCQLVFGENFDRIESVRWDFLPFHSNEMGEDDFAYNLSLKATLSPVAA